MEKKVKKTVVHKKHVETKQEFIINGLYPPMNLNFNFSPSNRQMELWQALQPNSCDKCGGEIIRKSTTDIRSVTGTIPACAKCGNENIPQVILGGGSAGGGKMLKNVNKVITPNGEVQTKDIKVGDTICSTRGSGLQVVTFLHPIEEHEFYKVSFEDGTSVECSEGHLWTVWQTKKRNHRIFSEDSSGTLRCSQQLETRQLYDWMGKKNSGMYSGCNMKIPLTDPVCFTKYNSDDFRLLHPYLMGAILGDGYMGRIYESGTIDITNGDIFVVKKIEDIASKYNIETRTTDNGAKNSWTVTLKVKHLKEFFRSLDFKGELSYDKFIPDVYKYAPIEARFELMQGLMDTDGYVDDRGHMEYSSASDTLAADVAWVSRSLGSYAAITIKKDPKYTYKGEVKTGMDSHRVYIRSPHASKMVTLPRKQSRCNDTFNGGASPFGKAITKVEPIGLQTSRCISVSDSSGEYLTDDFTVTHNSYVGCTWVLMSCMMFPRIKAVIARRTLTSLSESTWATLKDIMDVRLGLVRDVNYKEDLVKGVITLWNGSSISKKELELKPSDPNFQRLGSSEYTIAFVDEVSEISEKGVEVLYSRLRWMVAQTFKVPKIFLSTNPTQNWVRDRFVQDRNGDPVKTRRGDKFVRFSVFDNPDSSFVETYASSLGNMRKKSEVQRLLYGNWDFVETSDLICYPMFDGNVHLISDLEKRRYNPSTPLTISFDFNVIPQMSALVIQVDYEKKELYVIRELAGTPKEKNNSTPAMSRYVAKYINEKGHKIGGVVVTGDSAGAQRSTVSEVDVNNYSVIRSELGERGINITTNVPSKNPPQSTRLDFINDLLSGKLGWQIFIDIRCRSLTNDLIYQERNADGTKSKKKVTDPDTGVKYEKYGHFSDCFDYALCVLLNNEWNKFINGDLSESYSADAIYSARPELKFGF